MTHDQLKQTNLLLLEHKKFKLENVELNNQVSSYEKLVSNYQQTDSLRQVKISQLNDVIVAKDQEILEKSKRIKSLKKSLKVGTWTASGLVAISLILLLVK